MTDKGTNSGVAHTGDDKERKTDELFERPYGIILVRWWSNEKEERINSFIVGIVMQYISKKTETIIVVRCLRIATQICNTPNNCPSKIIPKMK